MLKFLFSKIMLVFIGAFFMMANFGLAKPVFGQELKQIIGTDSIIIASGVVDYTNEATGAVYNLTPADLQSLSVNDSNFYQVQANWPKNSLADKERISFNFSADDLSHYQNGEWQSLNLKHIYSLYDEVDLEVWWYEINLNGTIFIINSGDPRDLNLLPLINKNDQIKSLSVDFYLTSKDDGEDLISYHNYFALEINYNFAPTVSLLAPVNHNLINANQPNFSWQMNDPEGVKLWAKLQIWDQAQKLIFDRDLGQINSYNLPVVLADGTYLWQISVSEDGLNWIAQSEIFYFTIDTLAPEAPVIAVIADSDNNQIDVSWNSVENNVIYEIYRNDLFVATTDLNYFIDQGLEKGQNYTYYVVAVDQIGNRSLPSNSVTVYLLKPQISSVSFISGENINIVEPSAPAATSLLPDGPVAPVIPEGQIQSESTSSQAATNWALVIAIILAGLLILGGGLYWWYSREEDEI